MRRQMWLPEIAIWGQGQVPAHFAMIAQVEGQIRAEQLSDAVTRLTRRHPLLTARVIAEPDYRYWFETDGAAPIAIQIVPREDDHTWQQVAVETVGPPFDTAHGPLARVTLVHSPERSDIILALHHCVADGLSGAYALHDLLCLLVDPRLDLPPMTLSRSPAQLLPRWIRLLAGMVPLRLAFPTLRNAANGIAAPMGDFTHKDGTFHLLPWTLPSDQTKALVERSRRETVTVHSTLSTAVLRAWAAVCGGDSHSVSCPVSIRKHFIEPVEMALGIMIFPYAKFSLPNAPATPFWDQARQFRSDFVAHLKPFRLLFPSAVMQRVMNRYPMDQVAAAFNMEDDFSDHTLSITNLGRLALAEEYGPLRLTGFYGPLLDANAREVVLGVSTVNGTLACTMTFRDTILAPATAAEIKQATLAQLENALS